MTQRQWPFLKGHGTHNDFVLLPDVDDRLDLTDDTVRALCDRRGGIGADGVLRVVRRDGLLFMDYRNADGSIVETCGNGIRVFARYLVAAGLAEPGELQVGTRAGARRVFVPSDGGDITVEMGQATTLPDAKVTVLSSEGELNLPAVGICLGNPHLVAIDPGIDLDSLDLSRPPAVDPGSSYPQGVNVEFARQTGGSTLAMRVHERGVGETQSCGTGACAVAVAALQSVAQRGWREVDLPGGRLRIEWREDGEVTLTGPAVLVARGEVDLDLIG